jgi:outer membrane protein assembly factor BamC
MLQRLMVKLGTPKDSAKATVSAANSAAAAPRSRLLPDGVTVAFAGDYDQAWRRVGLALDRGGFTVEDRDRSKGVYEVRLASPGNPDGAKPGLFDRISNLFGSKGSTDTITRYRLVVQSTNGDATVAVQTASGQAAGSAGGRDVAKQLNINLE